MKLKNANINGCNVAVNNLYLMNFFFPKKLKIELKKRNLKFILELRIHNCPQIRTPHNFCLNGMIQSFPYIYNYRKPISNFYF